MAVAARVPPGGVVADIGTDHAYLPMSLVLRGRCDRAIATDSSPAALEAARQAVRSRGLEDRIELRLGDGLGVISPGETSTIVIAGVGGLTLLSILSTGMRVAMRQRMLVLQPMTHPRSVRRWAIDNGLGIVEEDLAQEGQRFYQVICLDPSGPSARYPQGRMDSDDIALELGATLIRERHALLGAFVRELLRECDDVLEKMRGRVSMSDSRFLKWIGRRDRLEEVLRCLLG